jgi:xylitol oxidase
VETNWAGNHAYGTAVLHRPATLEQLRELAAGAPRIHVLGSRHSFNAIADSDALVSLDALPPDVRVDRERGTVSFGAGLRYGELAAALDAEGLALHNLASLPHISVAGAIATGTHGSGDASGSLASAVAGIELVTSDGELLSVARGEPDFDGLVVGLGALGAVARLTLDVEPAYDVRQRVFEGLAWNALLEHFDAIAASADSVSVFTSWGDEVDQVWLKRRVTPAPEDVRGEFFGARAATAEHHPILGDDPVNCTPQLDLPGPWWDRLPHFRMGFRPSHGEELQSEYLVARPHATAAIEALRALGDRIRPLLRVTEIRTIAGDRLWMSPAYGRDSAAFHFTWVRDEAAVEEVLAAVEAALAPFDARPHWGKVFVARAATIAPLYERLPHFARLAGRLDPRGAFRNDWLEERVLGAS